ncbi:MAG: NYN domain-containing protein [Candidatus Omnitrophica bacterium]|nr:NYN domain-containing protein [Candidatus Omnitrophota bacterium]
MSLVYIVDGYNALLGCGLFENKELKDARAAFLAFLDLNRPHGSFRNKLIVVFDGSADCFGPVHDSPFEVIFTRGSSADEKIKEMVAASLDPKNIVVVTNDKAIAFFVRPYGAGVVSVGEFLKSKKNSLVGRVRLMSQKTEPKIDLNIVEREAITKELGRIWLKKKS